MYSSLKMIKDQSATALILEQLLMGRIAREQENRCLSDKKLGDMAFEYISDTQKKVNNLKHGKRRLTISDYYQLCQALDMQPDRILSRALDELEEESKQRPQPKKSVA